MDEQQLAAPKSFLGIRSGGIGQPEPITGQHQQRGLAVLLRRHGKAMGQMVGHCGAGKTVACGDSPQKLMAHIPGMGITGQGCDSP